MPLGYRSLLFTPGHKPEMLEKATGSQADALIFDLEDAVPIDERDTAREVTTDQLATLSGTEQSQPIFVRVSDVETDITHIEQAGVSPYGYLLPKMTSASAVEDAEDLLTEYDSGACTVPMIENGAGVINAPELATYPTVEALAFGGEDYTAAIGATRTESDHEIQYARQRVLAAADAAGVGTIDTVYTDFSDDEGLKEATKRSIELGYDSKPAIHPNQVPIINQAYTPDDEQVEWAETVLDAEEIGGERDVGAVNVDGEMIDGPLVDRARSIVERAELAGKR